VLPWELTVPVQVVFASTTPDGVVLDCTVAEEVDTGSEVRIPSGAPFSLLIDRLDGDGAAVVAAMHLLERWCSAGVVVQATTSSSSRALVLRHQRDEVVLEIL
jgi:hypothetical protein